MIKANNLQIIPNNATISKLTKMQKLTENNDKQPDCNTI